MVGRPIGPSVNDPSQRNGKGERIIPQLDGAWVRAAEPDTPPEPPNLNSGMDSVRQVCPNRKTRNAEASPPKRRRKFWWFR